MPAGNGWRQSAGAHPSGLLGRIARACHRHRWLTLAGWAAVAAFLIVIWEQFGAPPNNNLTSTDTQGPKRPQPPSGEDERD